MDGRLAQIDRDDFDDERFARRHQPVVARRTPGLTTS
jgi:hypothetical protein